MTNTPESLAETIARSKRAAEIAKAEGAAATAELAAIKARDAVGKVEDKLGKLQEKITKFEDNLKLLKAAEATLQTKLSDADASLAGTTAKAEEARATLARI